MRSIHTGTADRGLAGTRSRAVCLVVTLVMGAPPALAHGAPEPPASVGHEARAEGRRLFEEGLKHFNIGEYDLAIEKFKDSYKRDPVPGLLYNLAQAHRLKGDCGQALVLYRRYLAARPTTKDRARVEARIVEMEACRRPEADANAPSPDVLAAAGAPAPATETHVPPVAPAPPLAAPPFVAATPAAILLPSPEPPAPRSRRAAMALGATSLAFLAAGGYFAWDAKRAGDATSLRFAESGVYDMAARDEETRGLRSERLAIAGLAAAGLTAALAAWFYLRH
jgi:hypothetical protein